MRSLHDCGLFIELQVADKNTPPTQTVVALLLFVFVFTVQHIPNSPMYVNIAIASGLNTRKQKIQFIREHSGMR